MSLSRQFSILGSRRSASATPASDLFLAVLQVSWPDVSALVPLSPSIRDQGPSDTGDLLPLAASLDSSYSSLTAATRSFQSTVVGRFPCTLWGCCKWVESRGRGGRRQLWAGLVPRLSVGER